MNAADHRRPTSNATVTFDDIVAPDDRQVFLSEYQGTREWLHRGDPDRFESLLTWPELNTLIRDQRPSGHRFRLLLGGAPLPEETYHRTVPTLRGPLRQIDPGRLLARLRNGATLAWDAIDQCHPPVRALKQDVERALGAFAFVNLYASWGTESGTNSHWDDHDVFVLQLIGRKRWQLHPATRRWPLPDDGPTTPPLAYQKDVTLTAGSILYLPRGWWHLVTPMEEPSLHLTVGILRPTNADLLGWILNMACEADLLRQDLPPLIDDDARALHAATLRAALEEWIQPAYLSLFAQSQDAAHYLDPQPTLQAVADRRPEAWDPDADAFLLSTRSRVEDRATDVALVVAGREFLAPAAARATLTALVAGRRLRLGTLIEVVPAILVATLVDAGIVAIV